MRHPLSKIAVEFKSRFRQVLSVCDDLLLMVILVNSNMCCNLHLKSNYYAKYRHPHQKWNKSVFRVNVRILRIFDLDL